jgi:outer membrane biogenesis lipoprotein LolB
MKFKSITTIVVLLLLVASLSVTGCTTSTTSNTNQTPSATPTPSATTSTATNQSFLEKYLAEFKNAYSEMTNVNVKAWEITWVNNTSARLEWTIHNKTVNEIYNYVGTFIVFPTSQEATNYLNAMNKTAYSLASTQYPSGGAYQKVTGHAPEIYKEYQWNEGNPSNISEYKHHEIKQLDNITNTVTAKILTS